MKPYFIALLCGLVFCCPQSAFSADAQGGIKFNYSRIFIENLPIGNTISMKKVAKLPLRVTNKFDKPMLLVIRVEKPEKDLVEGFEAIPDASWVTTEYQSITAQAYTEVESDVLVTLPNDEKLFGKKFQVNISATLEHLSGVGFQVAYAGKGSLLFSIAPIRNEAALKDVEDNPSDSAFEVTPPRADMWEVAPNQRVKVVSEILQPLELVNRSDLTQTYLLSAIDPASTTFKLDEGSRFGGSVNHVILKKDEIKLKSGKHERLGIEIQVPVDADLTKGDLAYLIQVASGMKMGVKQYIVVYLHAAKKPMQLIKP